MQEHRYTYAFGYKSRDAAQAAIWDMMAGDEISRAEDPRVEPYGATRRGMPAGTRYRVTLRA